MQGVKYSTESYIQVATKVHAGKYTYPQTVYTGSHLKLIITCPVHGEFNQEAAAHLRGSGCPLCPKDKVKGTWKENYTNKCNQKHDHKYDYSKIELRKASDKITIGCPTHGDFTQAANKHASGQGCPKCKGSRISDTKAGDGNIFHQQAAARLEAGFDDSKFIYTRSFTPSVMICPEGHEFEISPNNFLRGRGCPLCSNLYSSGELEICEFLDTLNVEYETHSKIIPPYEVDIFIPSMNLGIEYNGAYWHSRHASRGQHRNKMNLMNEKGYRLIQVFELDWLENKQIVQSILRHAVRCTDVSIGARKTHRVTISNSQYKKFLEENHIKGYRPAKTKIGLDHNGDLVAVAGISGSELIRFCVKLNTNIHGALSKLLSEVSHSLDSYCDLSYFNGGGYIQAGFEVVGKTPPGFCYVRNHNRRSRLQFQKHKLNKEFGPNTDMTMTEEQLCNQHKWFRYYDCGSLKLKRVPIRHPSVLAL